MRWVLGVMLTLTTATAVAQEPTDQAADDERARVYFDAGRAHYEEGAYDRAREEFQRAWELSHRAPLLLNLATTNQRLGNLDEAISNIEEFLRLAPDAEGAELLRRRVENLRRMSAARATADETSEHDEETTPEHAAPEPAPASGPDGALMAGSIAGLATGGVGLALWAIFGGMTIAEDGALAAGCGATKSCSAAEVSNLQTFSMVADVGLGVGIAGLAVGAVLLVIALTSGQPDTASALRFDGRNLTLRF